MTGADPFSEPRETSSRGDGRSGAADAAAPGAPGEAFLAAVTFLTRLPVTSSVPASPEVWRRSLVYFPVVGALLGGATGGILWLAGLVWPLGLAVLLALLAEVLLTGGLHEDGLADCCDALGGGWTRDDVLRILKDSRVGTFGVLGLVFGIGLKAATIDVSVTSAGWERWWEWGAVLVAAAAIGRATMVLALSLLPPVTGRESLARGFAGGLSREECVGCLTGLAAAVSPYAVVQPLSCLLSLVLCAVGIWLLLGLFQRRLGGISGDCLGCLGFVSQLLVLLGGAARIEP
jgi:adenosylcobinamide-GDP ribazoletransferase